MKWSDTYYDFVNILSERVCFLEMFRKNGEYEHENQDVVLHRKSEYIICKLIKRCLAAEENLKYFEEETIKLRKELSECKSKNDSN